MPETYVPPYRIVWAGGRSTFPEPLDHFMQWRECLEHEAEAERGRLAGILSRGAFRPTETPDQV